MLKKSPYLPRREYRQELYRRVKKLEINQILQCETLNPKRLARCIGSHVANVVPDFKLKLVRAQDVLFIIRVG